MMPKLPSSSAVLRLAQSRTELLQEMRDDSRVESSVNQPSTPEPSLLAGLRLLKTQPGAHLLVQTLQQLWAKNPWHVLGKSAVEASNIMLTPLAQRSPVKLVMGAFVVGGVVFLVRPWRLLSKTGVIAALLGR
jgi:hypothetical protein